MTAIKRSGVTLWRQIADQLRDALHGWAADNGGRVPPESELAGRFGVNRHTVRAALAALAEEGLIRSERGRGTFVQAKPRISYPLASRTRFSEALESQNSVGRFQVLSETIIKADTTVADALGLAKGVGVLKLDTLGLSDGQPISFGTHWFDAARFAALPVHVRATGSITAGLTACGVADYVRKSTIIEARTATVEEARHLDIGGSAIVLVTRAVNADLQGRAIQFSEGRFAADKVQIAVDGSV